MGMSTIFINILNMSLTATYCIAAVVILRLLLKRQPKILSYLLWSVVLFRLLCPFSISSDLSLLRLHTDIVSQEYLMGQYAADQDVWQGKNYSYAEDLSEAEGADKSHGTMTSVTGGKAEKWAIQEQTVRLGKIFTVGGWIWLTGMVAFTAYGVVSALRLRRFLQKAVLVEGGFYEAEGISTPFVLGIIHSRIYLPTGLSAEERSYVLEHERVHVARKDYPVKILAWFARCIHWFNPFVWLAFALMESDMEMSCDEAVLHRLGMETKQDYSRALLALSCDRSKMGNCPTAFGEGKVKDRVRNILTYRKRAFATVAVITAVLIVIVIGLSLNPMNHSGEEAEELLRLGEKDQFVMDYANAWSDRNGNALVELYIDEETAFEHVPMLEKTEDGYIFGYSSPWPIEFWRTIPTGAGTDEGTSEIRYYAWTSDPHVSVWKEVISFKKTDEGYRVTDSSLTCLDSIASEEEYMDAYWGDGAYHFIDYEESGFVEAINYQTESDSANGDNDRNAVYRSPETAAEWIFNLTGGEGTAQTASNGTAIVEYTFSDGSSILIPMKDANFNGQTENGSDDLAESDSQAVVNAEVWILDLAVWNAGAP